jgi:hypothetical protein
MIPRLHLWQNHSGAAHRMYFDTPPLTGWCRYTSVNLHYQQQIAVSRYTQVYRPGDIQHGRPNLSQQPEESCQ